MYIHYIVEYSVYKSCYDAVHIIIYTHMYNYNYLSHLTPNIKGTDSTLFTTSSCIFPDVIYNIRKQRAYIRNWKHSAMLRAV